MRKFVPLLLAAVFFACSSDEGDGGEQNNTLQHGGRTYKTVKIGGQVWMAENLDYNAPGSKCYDNDPANCYKYGRLYDWEAAKKACPEGWHLPSNTEWDKLVDFAGGEDIAGKHLRAKEGWDSYDSYGIVNLDTYGFSALPGGGYSDDRGFASGGTDGFWWTASEYGSDDAYFRLMYENEEFASWDYEDKAILFSVRCVKD